MTHENKFGMFIHWGVYALMGVHEQVFAKLDIPREEYEGLYKRFDPVDYDPEKWVLLAKEAGMKYICFTAKHHDGFCMWDTKYTDYNIMNTPYGKDVLAMLAAACKKHGMLLSIYYSNPDWHHPDAYNPESTHQYKAIKNSENGIENYVTYIKNQVTELLCGYGPIYTFFWDIPPHIYDPSLNELVRKLQPGIYINNRGWDAGDFSTPEREEQKCEGARFEKMTEACNSVGEHSWGYRVGEDFYSMRYLTAAIDRIMAMGGSYLLNVGPDAKGVVTEEYAARIRKVGDWYNRMGGALECHEADDREYTVMDNECIKTKKNDKSYLHFFNGTKSGAFCIKGVTSVPRCVRLLNTNKELRAAIERMPHCHNADGTIYEVLHVSEIPIDELASEAIVIEIEW